jgi:transcription initiation factor TFIID subunit 10
LLDQIGDFTPTIPPAVIEYYLTRSGVATKDERIIKLVALAAQKFVADVAVDALQHCKQRQAGAQTTKKQVRYRPPLSLFEPLMCGPSCVF